MTAQRTSRIPWIAVVVLIAIVLIFVVIRIVVDVPNIASGTIPDESLFEHRYARYPWLAYAHILPGVVFLLIAPFQLWRSFRNRNPERHRRLGRIAFTAGLLSGVFAIIFGFFQSFGGPPGIGGGCVRAVVPRQPGDRLSSHPTP